MYPNLFGIKNCSYITMLVIGIIVAVFVFVVYFRKMKFKKIELIDLLICSLIAVLFGIICAVLFQNLYDFIENPHSYSWTWSMTFLGGFIGGFVAFTLLYNFFYKKFHQGCTQGLLTIIPGVVTLGHCFGRIGCFLAGCCYGKESSEWYALYFPTLEKRVIPTQLIEAVFLLILSLVLLALAFTKKRFIYNTTIYLIGYGLFRFLIEFIRDDHRGFTLGIFSPSQLLSIIMFVVGLTFLFYIVIKKNIYSNHKQA